ncbi:HD domain-containing phosphohydrolase [Terasakiella sp. A23]|uniref:HD domain-containing phosphohydrolase n=1 Tax=Terasakiella sp. FCG-A23 TaxID=3080561 RepID=UPI002954ACC0|nr:HD domain-containing phosphohydrolase [Terasakiella sp. A23]MDV7338017.1 HD domain-containing phosphohydrolase [Terasakiella sp. A23]
MAEVTADRFKKLLDIGLALSTERNSVRLMEKILNEAKSMCNADGGTLYRVVDEDSRLRFEIMRNDSLKIYNGGTSGNEITLPPVELYDPQTGEENRKNVASYCALSKNTISIDDAYEFDGFDFQGTKKFDEATGYRSKSFLTVPLYNNEGRVIAVLQLLNAQDEQTGEVIPFDKELQPFVEALAAQAAIALDNQLLVEAQRKLLVSFIELIAGAIDAKSAYTGGHCQRVPVLTDMLAAAAIKETSGTFADFDMTEEEQYELHIAGLLHDCGKVTTPEYIVDKATKLETIYDRIHEVRMRFEILKRDAQIEFLQKINKTDDQAEKEKLKHAYAARLKQLDDDFAFVAECNVGGEFMAPERMDRLDEIAKETWVRTLSDRIGIGHEELTRKKDSGEEPALPVTENLLSDQMHHIFPRKDKSLFDEDNPYGFKMTPPENMYNQGELYNLKVKAGTLTEEDRFKINDHIIQTIIMLDQLPFPRYLKKVPEYAGGHHEKMDGTGYPRKLAAEDMSWPARMMAVADIFEALTAADRPYKLPKKLSQSIKIMSFMVKDNHLDKDLFELFLTSGAYLDYANKFLRKDQIDEVDISQYVTDKAAE